MSCYPSYFTSKQISSKNLISVFRYKFYLTLANQIAHYKTDIVNKNLNILVFLTYDHQQIDELMKLMNPAGLMDTTTLRPY